MLMLTCVNKSMEYSERNVVLPVPVWPVKTVNSPRRKPCRISFSASNRFHLVPLTCNYQISNMDNSMEKSSNKIGTEDHESNTWFRN